MGPRKGTGSKLANPFLALASIADSLVSGDKKKKWSIRRGHTDATPSDKKVIVIEGMIRRMKHVHIRFVEAVCSMAGIDDVDDIKNVEDMCLYAIVDSSVAEHPMFDGVGLANNKSLLRMGVRCFERKKSLDFFKEGFSTQILDKWMMGMKACAESWLRVQLRDGAADVLPVVLSEDESAGRRMTHWPFIAVGILDALHLNRGRDAIIDSMIAYKEAHT